MPPDDFPVGLSSALWTTKVKFNPFFKIDLWPSIQLGAARLSSPVPVPEGSGVSVTLGAHPCGFQAHPPPYPRGPGTSLLLCDHNRWLHPGPRLPSSVTPAGYQATLPSWTTPVAAMTHLMPPPTRPTPNQDPPWQGHGGIPQFLGLCLQEAEWTPLGAGGRATS